MPAEPATTRIFRRVPGAEEIITYRLVCDACRDYALDEDWKVRPYDGPLPCFLCLRS